MASGGFKVLALTFSYGPPVAEIPALLGGSGKESFIIKISAESISDLQGPIEGIIEYYDKNDRHRSKTFGNSVEVIASSKSAFTPKVRFKSLTVNGQVVRGIWSIPAR